MAIGVASQSDFDKELLRLSTPVNERTIEIKHGRGSKLETPQIIRELVASESICGASAKELAEAFNVSESSVSAYKHNATSTASYHNPDESLAKANDRIKNVLGGKAQTKLQEALDAIVFPSDIKPQIASSIARDMSSVMKNINPTPDTIINNQQVIVYKPRQREEDSYEVIDVSRNE